MNPRFVRALLAASIFCSAPGAFHIAVAADSGPKVSKALQAPLAEAQKDLQSGDVQGAMAQIKTVQAMPDLTDSDKFVVNEFLGSAALKANDYPTATTAFEAMAESPVLPDEMKQSVFHNALLLSAQAKHYQKTVQYGQQLAALNGLDDQTTADLAIAYYETGDMPHAQQFAQQGIDLAKKAGKQPNPGLLQIVMNSQVKSNNQAGAEQTLEQLVQTSGDPQAFGQLIDVSLSTPGMNSMYFLDMLRLKLLIGNAQPDDYSQLANAAYLQGYPKEAVTVLRQGIASGKISSGKVAQTLRKSENDAAMDERQLPGIAAAAARSKTGEQDVKLAEDYWGYGRYADAETAARRAIGKGGIKSPAEGSLILGMALAAQGKYDDAIQALAQVNGNQAAQKTAHLWTIYAQSKKGAAPPAAAQTPAH